ncbi:MAG: pseudaminic acid synthase [Candidatus Baltobacteraceae bacterium]
MQTDAAIPFGRRTVGPGKPPLVIAELSGNHNQSLDRALAIVDAAAAAGAHAVKLQTYTADIMTLDVREPGFLIEDRASLWYGRSLYDLYREAHTPWEWHDALFARARELGMECLSTPFDASAIAFLERYDPPAYKIASFELTDLELISAAAATGRPLILSTGMASLEEIAEAVHAARSSGAGRLILLKCTSTYPASPANSNLATIPDLRQRFDALAGISDHTPGIGVAVAAVALGAVLIEKHFTLRRADGGIDSAFSLEPAELRALVQESERAWLGVGSVRYGALKDEEASVQFRRSLYVVRDMRAGETYTRENVRAIRPGYGLTPKHYREVLGRRAAADTRKGTPLTWNLIE